MRKYTHTFFFTVLVASAFLLAGCAQKSVTVKDLAITPETYPCVDGSTSAHPLSVIIACTVFDVPYKWEEFIFDDGTIRPIPREKKGNAEALKRISRIWHEGTHSSYMNLIAKKADLILVARKPSADENAFAEERGVSLLITPIALDAFVFIVNTNNGVNALTTDEIVAIYTGGISNWSEVGGAEREIHPYQRNRNSGSQELMETLVMKENKMMNVPTMTLYGMMGPINMLAEDEKGLGYSVYYFEKHMAPNAPLRVLAIDGVAPNAETIADGTYPYTTKVYAVLRDDLAETHKARSLLAWLTSDEGQTIVKEAGYVPIR